MDIVLLSKNIQTSIFDEFLALIVPLPSTNDDK